MIPPIQGPNEAVSYLHINTYIRYHRPNIPIAGPLTDPTMKKPTAVPRTVYHNFLSVTKSITRMKVTYRFKDICKNSLPSNHEEGTRKTS